jgi:hypothetical protein
MAIGGALALLLALASTAEAQLGDMLERLLGGGSIANTETLSATPSEIVLRLTVEGVEDLTAVVPSVRLLDVRMRQLEGFTFATTPVDGADDRLDLALRYHGTETVASAFAELRLEAGGAVVARSIQPLVQRWHGSGGSALASDDEAGAGPDPSPSPAPSTPPRVPREIVVEPIAMVDTPTGPELAEEAAEAEPATPVTVTPVTVTPVRPATPATTIRDHRVVRPSVAPRGAETPRRRPNPRPAEPPRH